MANLISSAPTLAWFPSVTWRRSLQYATRLLEVCNAQLTTSQEEFDRVFTINTRGQFFVAREGYKHLNDGGRIILTSSNTARGFVVPKHAIYSGSKGSIESFVPVLAKDCGSRKITVNAVAPGGTVTDMFHDVAHHYIPGGEKLSIDQLKEVSIRSLSVLSLETNIYRVGCCICLATTPMWLPT